MKYILDSSVAVKWVLVEPYSDKADKLLKNAHPHFPFVRHLSTLP